MYEMFCCVLWKWHFCFPASILRKNGLAGPALHGNQQRSAVIHLLLGKVGCAMVQSKIPVPGRPTNRLEQGKGLLRMQKVRVGGY